MEDSLVNPDDPYGEDFLAHYGVPGMKWGVRRIRRGANLAGGAAKAYYKGARKVQKGATGAVKKLQGAQIKTVKKMASATVGGIKKLQRAQINTAKKELAIARAAGGAVKKLQGAQIKTVKKMASATVGGIKKLQSKQIATAKAEVRLAKSVVDAVTPVFQSTVKKLAVSGRPEHAAKLKAAGMENTAGYLASIGQQAIHAYATGIVVGAVAKSVATTLKIIN